MKFNQLFCNICLIIRQTGVFYIVIGFTTYQKHLSTGLYTDYGENMKTDIILKCIYECFAPTGLVLINCYIIYPLFGLEPVGMARAIILWMLCFSFIKTGESYCAWKDERSKH